MDTKTAFLKSVSDYPWSQTRPDGSIICYKHGVEHTGTNAYSMVLDGELYKKTGEEVYYERALKRALRTLIQLRKAPASSSWYFYPGNMDSQNCSNNIIDCGSAVDSLASFYLQFTDRLKKAETERLRDAIYKVSDTYLKGAILTKHFPNQFLWGATGLASAYRLFGEKSWKEALLECLELFFKNQNQDGSIPYYPEAEKYGTHVGDTDISPYYHSRHMTFALHVLDALGLKKWESELLRGVDFLVGITHPDGIKEMRFEAKRWYWESDYEVASNPFDIPCLVWAHERTGDDLYLRYASLSMNQLLRHQLADGGITSHLGPQKNYQCRIFWNGRIAWVARNIDKIPLEPPGLEKPYLQLFEDSGVVKFENRDYCVMIRGRKKPMNISFGGSVGGGTVAYLGTKEGGWQNKVRVPEWRAATHAFTESRGLKPARNARLFLRENGVDARRRLYKSLVELRAGNLLFSLAYPLRHVLLKSLDELFDTYSTQWDLDSSPRLSGNRASFEATLSKRDGQKSKEVVELTYEFHEDGFDIEVSPTELAERFKEPFKMVSEGKVRFKTGS